MWHDNTLKPTKTSITQPEEGNAEDAPEIDLASEATPLSGPTVRDTALLELLVCPLTLGTLRYDARNNELISDKASLAYPITAGIPIMLADEAREI